MAAAAGEGSAGVEGTADPDGPWLHAYHDPVANLHTFSSCMQLSDLNADGDSKLLVATADRHLKIYKGTQVISEHALLDSLETTGTPRFLGTGSLRPFLGRSSTGTRAAPCARPRDASA